MSVRLIISKRLHKRNHKWRKCDKEKLKARIECLRKEMEEISDEQGRIREGQREMRVKIETIGRQCQQLRHETDLILQQSATTQQRLSLIFRILKARDSNDFATVATLTHLLRGAMVTKQI